MGQRGTGFPGTGRPAFSGGSQERESRGRPTEKESRDDADPEDPQATRSHAHDQDRRVLHGRPTPTPPQVRRRRFGGRAPTHLPSRRPRRTLEPRPRSRRSSSPRTTRCAMPPASATREWFALLDGWGATDHSHTEIARWLNTEHGVPGWWSQNITVDYERARGMRKPGADGRRLLGVGVRGRSPPSRSRCSQRSPTRRCGDAGCPDAPMRQRPTRAALTARFDWADPKSRVVVIVGPKGPGKSVVTVTCEQVPDADAADALKPRVARQPRSAEGPARAELTARAPTGRPRS